MKKSYEQRKAEAREEAIQWQIDFAEKNTSWEELAEAQAHFEELGRRYGLLQEFRREGIV